MTPAEVTTITQARDLLNGVLVDGPPPEPPPVPPVIPPPPPVVPPPPILSPSGTFTANKVVMTLGESLALSWDIRDAIEVQVNGIDQPASAVGMPFTPASAGTAVYTLTAAGAFGTVPLMLTVSVTVFPVPVPPVVPPVLPPTPPDGSVHTPSGILVLPDVILGPHGLRMPNFGTPAPGGVVVAAVASGNWSDANTWSEPPEGVSRGARVPRRDRVKADPEDVL